MAIKKIGVERLTMISSKPFLFWRQPVAMRAA
jgi:hypothetical protein